MFLQHFLHHQLLGGPIQSVSNSILQTSVLIINNFFNQNYSLYQVYHISLVTRLRFSLPLTVPNIQICCIIQGPVVQSIVSLTSLLRGQLFRFLMPCHKMVEGHIESYLSVCVCVPESCPGHNLAVHVWI